MAQPYVGEIRMFAGNFAPAGWMFCEGQLLPISENETLFQLIGTTYGGDGESTFALPTEGSHPDPSRHGFILAGWRAEEITLTIHRFPHTRTTGGRSHHGRSDYPGGNGPRRLLTYPSSTMYLTELHPGSVSPVGGSQPTNFNLTSASTHHFVIGSSKSDMIVSLVSLC